MEENRDLNIFKLLRTCYGFEAAEVAKETGITKQYLNAIERGEHYPSGELLDKFCSLYKLNRDTLLFFERTTNKRKFTHQQMLLKILRRIAK